MLRLSTIMMSVSLLFGCGARTRMGGLDAGDPCGSSTDCPIGTTCLGCEQTDRTCLSGCTVHEDCELGFCFELECVTCPCPGECR